MKLKEVNQEVRKALEQFILQIQTLKREVNNNKNPDEYRFVIVKTTT